MNNDPCPLCGSEVRMVWLSGDPPEPYGEVCDCPGANELLRDAREDKTASDREGK